MKPFKKGSEMFMRLEKSTILYNISIARSYNSKAWKCKEISWAELVKKFGSIVFTDESLSDYFRMTSDEKTAIKNSAGAFVGGRLEGTIRSNTTLQTRDLITLDIDSATPEQAKEFKAAAEKYTGCIYTTHSHTPRSPRFRYVAPLSRSVTPAEYVAICEYLINNVFAADYVDLCSTRPAQLMFFPTAAKDGEFLCKDFTGEIFDVDRILAEAKNSSSQRKWEEKAGALAAKQANPLEKEGVIGEFCRAFSIIDVLTDPELLGNQYEATTDPKRFLLKGSHSVPGVLVYPYKGDDGSIVEAAFMYSHHAKDPTCNTLCNAFDAYRLHKFGDLDTEESLKKAIKGIRDMPKMQEALKALRKKQMEKDFANDEDIDLSGYDVQEPKAETASAKEPEKKKHLDIVFEINEKLVKRGQNDPRPANIKSNFDRILLEDPVFSGLRKNLFLDRIEIEGKLPWRNKEMQRRYGNVWCDSDLVAALSYIARYYGDMHNKQMLEDSIQTVADKRAYHPIVEKLSQLPAWDGVKRAESIFIDYLGAEDSAYTRAVTMKTLQALVERVKRPGCKYDYMIILDGGQGIGKTTMFDRLSLGYHTDTLSLRDMDNLQKAYEQTQGAWIVEVSELAGAKKAEVEFIKAFVSRREDKCRKAYGRYVDISPRQFVLVGTTNETSDYLRDPTGNRRFYPVHCAGMAGEDGKVDIYYAYKHFTADIVDQVWAEVLQSLKDEAFSAELPADLKSEAESRQAEMAEKDDRLELVQKYVDMLVPADWYSSYDEDQKRQYTQRYLRDTLDEDDDMGTEPLKYITPAHLWQYAFEQPIVKLDNFQTRAMGKLLRQCDLVYKVVKDPKTKKCVKGWTKS